MVDCTPCPSPGGCTPCPSLVDIAAADAAGIDLRTRCCRYCSHKDSLVVVVVVVVLVETCTPHVGRMMNLLVVVYGMMALASVLHSQLHVAGCCSRCSCCRNRDWKCRRWVESRALMLRSRTGLAVVVAEMVTCTQCCRNRRCCVRDFEARFAALVVVAAAQEVIVSHHRDMVTVVFADCLCHLQLDSLDPWRSCAVLSHVRRLHDRDRREVVLAPLVAHLDLLLVVFVRLTNSALQGERLR